MDKLNNNWKKYLEEECEKDYYKKLTEFLSEEYSTQTIYPKVEDIFNAFSYTDYEDVKVVILGQDPYHGPDQSHGLAFSVKKGVKIPPSLRNIYKEIQEEYGGPIPDHGNLEKWAREGVLLLNTVLTVREGQAHSHRDKGWEIFTDRAIESLNKKETPVVYLLWGGPAREKKKLIDRSKHFVLESVHPSPLSAYRGFLGNNHFKKANKILVEQGLEPVDWKIE